MSKYKKYFQKTKNCRICGNTNLKVILDLGKQGLTGVFPKKRNQRIPVGPLVLVKCVDGEKRKNCGLVQLLHSYNKKMLYGNNYGYRSGLNNSMVAHLKDISKEALLYSGAKKEDLVVDIGSNDGTLLNFYQDKGFNLVGIDPTAHKFKNYYFPKILVIPEFFSPQHILSKFDKKQAKIIFSIAMFYDLQDPIKFAKDVYKILDDEGVWILEQSYLPSMLKHNAYDTICQEHIEYYAFKQLKWILDQANFKILSAKLNNTNGGSIKLIVAKACSRKKQDIPCIRKLVEKENRLDLGSMKPFERFLKRIERNRSDLRKLVRQIKESGKVVFGYGASTKGNVVLQYCGFSTENIPYIAEVNQDKFGSFTPVTKIPIISEQKARELNPDYYLVLPWHFRDNILKKERNFHKSKSHYIFPLPKIEIV